jgi:hypothetical protein
VHNTPGIPTAPIALLAPLAPLALLVLLVLLPARAARAALALCQLAVIWRHWASTPNDAFDKQVIGNWQDKQKPVGAPLGALSLPLPLHQGGASRASLLRHSFFSPVVGVSVDPLVVGRDWSPVSSNEARGCCCRTPGGH